MKKSPRPIRRVLAPFQRVLHVFVQTFRGFIGDNIGRLGAALAFYTTLAVAPLLVIAISVASVVFATAHARDRIIQQISSLAGPQAADALKNLQTMPSSTGVFGTWLGVATLVFGAMGVFYHLQDSLNFIWRVPVEDHHGWVRLIRKRLFSLATVMITGFLLLVSLVLSAALTWLGSQAISRFGLPVADLEIINTLLSFAIVTVLFALIFKLLPDTHVKWGDVWMGALLTAVLFTLGKYAFGIYVSRSHVTSAYGAAGSLVALLLWSYYAAQIAFFGAEFTRVTATLAEGDEVPRHTIKVPRRRARPAGI